MTRDEMIEVLEAIVECDRSEVYEYHESRSWDGKHPKSGQRWLTPREIAQRALKELRKND